MVTAENATDSQLYSTTNQPIGPRLISLVLLQLNPRSMTSAERVTSKVEREILVVQLTMLQLVRLFSYNFD